MSTFNPGELNFSDSALSHFKDMLESRGKGAGIKLGVKEAGCSGYEYTFDFVDDALDDYQSFEKENLTIFVDTKTDRQKPEELPAQTVALTVDTFKKGQ